MADIHAQMTQASTRKTVKHDSKWVALILSGICALGPCVAPYGAAALAQTTAGKFAAQPKPASPSKAETDLVASLRSALAPLVGAELSAGDAEALKGAFSAIGSSSFERALELQGQIADSVARKLVTWYLLRSGRGSVRDYKAFLAENPSWPERSTLVARSEEVLFTQGGNSTEILAFFGKTEPETGVGLAALASAYLADGNEAEAKRLAVKAWRERNFPASLEAGFLGRFGAMLTLADHKWRLDRLLIDTLRYEGEKTQCASVARRVIALLPTSEQKKANARLGALLGNKTAKAQIEALSSGHEADWGLVFHRIQTLRRGGRADDAAKLMLSAPTDPSVIVAPDEWWEERQANAYAALKAKNPKLAYDLVRNGGELSVNPAKEQAFMAGWLALRYLKKPELAAPHFEALRKVADGPLSRAKAAYWLGRTAEARGKKDEAQEFFRLALVDRDVFHAMLSRHKLETGRLGLDLPLPAAPSGEQIQRLLGMDAAKAVIFARKAGLDASVMRAFLVNLRNVLKSEAEAALLAQLAEAVGDTQSAVRIGKASIARGQNLFAFAYPVHPFPGYTPLREPPETAMLLGLARQETEFNTLIVSGAGAKGLLQVMTVTAKHVCQDYKVKCEIDRLLTDPSYNAKLSSAYVGDRMEEFSGSYVLTLAGYNAGPGRTREWIREFGDPRDSDIDPIDWIERIPIKETREYVAKVLANIQVYRSRLGEGGRALRLTEDLVRGRGVPHSQDKYKDDTLAQGDDKLTTSNRSDEPAPE